MTRTAYNSTLSAGKPMKRGYIQRKPGKRTSIRTLCPGKRKKPPPTTLKKYDRILMPLCREIAMLRAGCRCEKCGRSDRKLDMHHLWKKPLSMRWEPDGMAMLCFYPCHNYGTKEDPSAEENPERMRQFIRKIRGDTWYLSMLFLSKKVARIAEVDIEMEKWKLENILAAEKNERT